MRILVYGAGCLGSLYAALLTESRQEVTILARGERLARIQSHGIELTEGKSGHALDVRVPAIEVLDPADVFDLVLVVLPRHRVGEVLPALGRSDCRNVLFLGNNASGPGELVDALGPERVLLGFPGAAAVHARDRIRYLILSRREQPTTLGELNGGRTPRLRAIADTLSSAGFPTATSANVDAWLKTHAAEVSPTANAFYLAAGDHRRLARTPDGVLLMLRAIRELYACLNRLEVPITPAAHRVFQWLPESVLQSIMKRMLASETTAIKVGHALEARDEWRVIAKELRVLAASAELPTPAYDQLCRYLDAETPPLPDGSAVLTARRAA
ncbi:MAG: ketopantoate reductase family protein [bacterium]|nr:ketopantoate reductase family protein [bacterium]